ncbi:MAG: YceI family protein [Microbacteriaceae bacterium]|nr:YceI family protein [Microbacteriaceae bacterium]
MHARTKVIIISLVSVLAVGAIAVVAAPNVYRMMFTSPAEPVPTLSADDSALRLTDVRALTTEEVSGTWIVGQGSSAGYRVDELLNGEPFTVVGSSDSVRGSLVVSGLTLESAEFEIDVATITTDNAQRDRFFQQQAIDTSVHPTATFVLSESVTPESAPETGEVIDQTLMGELTIAGVTQPVTFIAQVRSDGENAEIAGQIPITFADFGITAPSLGFVVVEPTGFVEFSLVIQRTE